MWVLPADEYGNELDRQEEGQVVQDPQQASPEAPHVRREYLTWVTINVLEGDSVTNTVCIR